jgi:hypothetical protein
MKLVQIKDRTENSDPTLFQAAQSILAAPRLRGIFSRCTLAEPKPKEKERTQGLRHVLFIPSNSKSNGPRTVWGKESKQAFYAVEHAERLQQIRSRLDPKGRWQVAFFYRVGKARDGRAVSRVLEQFRQNRGIWEVLYPDDQLDSGEPWSFLHLIKRYRELNRDELLKDFEELILATLEPLNAAFSQAE